MNAGPDGRHHGHGALGRRAGQPRHVRSVHGRPRRGADGIAAIDTRLSIQIAAVRTANATLDTRLPTQIADLRSEQGTSNAGLETRLSAIETRLTWRIVGGHCGGRRDSAGAREDHLPVPRCDAGPSPESRSKPDRWLGAATNSGRVSRFPLVVPGLGVGAGEPSAGGGGGGAGSRGEEPDRGGGRSSGGGTRPILAAHLMKLRAAVLALGVRRRGPSPPRRDGRAAAPTHTQRRGPLHAQHRFSSAAPRRCSVFRRWTPTAQLKRRCSRQSAGARGTRRTRPNGRR